MKPEPINRDVLKQLQAQAEREQRTLNDVIERLLRDEETYHIMAENITDVISRFTVTGIYVFVTPSCQTLLGYAPDELIGQSIYALVHPDDIEKLRAAQRDILENRGICSVEHRLRTKSGRYIWFETIARLASYDRDTKPDELIAVSRDVSERRYAQLYLQAALDSSLNGIMGFKAVRDANGAIIDFEWTLINRRAAEMVSRAQQDLLGRRLLVEMPGNRETGLFDRYVRVVETGETLNYEHYYRYESVDAWFQITAVKLEDGFVVTFADITERIARETAQRRSEARLRSLIESQTALIVRTDMDGHFTYVSDSCLRYYGWRRAEFVGAPWADTVIADDHPAALAAVDWCIAHPGRPFQVRLRKPHEDGAISHTLWEFVALVDANGVPTEIQCIGFDITEQVEAEHVRLEAERLRASLKKEREYNALVQRTVASLEHDVRQPLAAIASAKDMLDRYFDRMDEHGRRDRLTVIGRELNYITELLSDMTLLLRGRLEERPFKPMPTNIGVLCQAIINELTETLQTPYELVLSVQEVPAPLPLDETLVTRILLNLLSNAIKFSPQGGIVRLEVTMAGSTLCLMVADSGVGIPVEEQAHIFEPFFRSPSVQDISGSGLGLSIVKDCVDRHRGRISVSSIVGMGTVFIVELPT